MENMKINNLRIKFPIGKNICDSGTEVCSKCKGEGHIFFDKYTLCEKCGGKGYITWIEKLVGINDKKE